MGFTFKNIHSDTMGVVTAVASNPLLPAVKTVTYSPQFMDGTLDYSEMNGRLYYEDKIIQIAVKVKAASFLALVEKCSAIAAWLQGSGDLQLDECPGKTYKAKVQSSIDFVPQILGHYAELTVQFRVPPFASGGEQQYSETLTAGQTKSITINNNGYYSPPTIMLSDGNTGTFTCGDFSYTGILDDVLVRGDIQEIYRAGEVVTHNSNYKFIEIPPGTSNLSVSSTVDVNVVIKFENLLF